MTIPTNVKDPMGLEKLVRAAIASRIRQIVSEETEAATKRVTERIGAELDQITLKVFSLYEIRSYTDRLVIEVRKP